MPSVRSRCSLPVTISLVAGMGLGLSAAAGQSVRCLTLTGRQAPGAPAGALFGSFEQPVISSTAGVVFRATLATGAGGVTTSNDVGIWRYPATGAPILVVRESDLASTMTGVTLIELGQPVADATSTAVGYWARLQGSGITGSNDRAMFMRDDTFHFPWYQSGNV